MTAYLRYASKVLLESHKDRVHSKKELPWICEVCGKRHFSERDLRSHIQFKHNEAASKCNICGKVVKCIRRHIQMHEQADIEINCEVCAKKVPTYNALKAHMKVHFDDK